MAKSVYEINEQRRIVFGTLNNEFEDFPVGQRVRIICVGQDHYFFNGNEKGTVTKNTGKYLGIMIKFDKPRHFENGYIQTHFNFEPKDLMRIG